MIMKDGVNEIKDKVQKEGLNAWELHGYIGTLEMATGVGKSRCGVLAAKRKVKEKPDAKILIITPSESIRDTAWKEEFNKWKANSVFNNNVVIECIQTAWKRQGDYFDLVICDEIHNYVIKDSKKEYSYYKFFENNTYDWILGLSATIDVDQRVNLSKVAQVVYKVSTTKALSLGLISPFTIYTVPVELTDLEKAAYDKADKIVNKLLPLFNWNMDKMFACMKAEYFERYCKINALDYDAPHIKNAPFVCNNAIQKRKNILYEASEKEKAILNVAKFIEGNGIIFSQTTDFVDSVTEKLGDICVRFHSKIRAKEKKEALKKLQDRRTKVKIIATARALNEGANIKDVKFAIIASGTSKIRDVIQRVGRAVRLDKDKSAIIIRLYVKNSQEEKWMNNSMKELNSVDLNSLEDLVTILEKKSTIQLV